MWPVVHYISRVLSTTAIIDDEHLSRWLVKVSQNSNPTTWAEGFLCLDSGASISVISRKFASLSCVKVYNVNNDLQLLSASGQRMVFDGLMTPMIDLTNCQITQYRKCCFTRLQTEEFFMCTADMVKLPLLSSNWPFEKCTHCLFDIGNKAWEPKRVNQNSPSYFKSVKTKSNPGLNSCQLSETFRYPSLSLIYSAQGVNGCQAV